MTPTIQNPTLGDWLETLGYSQSMVQSRASTPISVQEPPETQKSPEKSESRQTLRPRGAIDALNFSGRTGGHVHWSFDIACRLSLGRRHVLPFLWSCRFRYLELTVPSSLRPSLNNSLPSWLVVTG